MADARNYGWLILAVLLAGCSHAPPMAIVCKGKGVLTGTASAMVYGGNFTLTGDCGEGFEYTRTTPK